MEISIEKKENSEVSLKVEFPEKRVEEELSQAFRKLVKNVEIPGFRKGKIPRKIFERRFGEERIREGVIKKVYPEVHREIVNRYKLLPLIEPEMKILQFSRHKPLILEVNLITGPEVKLDKYKEIKVEREKIKISEGEIEEALKNLQKQSTTYIPVEEKREIREGDGIIMDWQGFYKKGKKPFIKKGKGEFFKVGSSTFPPSFSKGLIGLKVGERKKIEITFPPSFSQKELAGEKVSFDINIREIKKEKIPQIDDEFARDLQFDNLEALKKHIKESLAEVKENKRRKSIENQIIKKVVDSSQVNLSPSLIERKKEERLKGLELKLKNQKYSLEEYIKQQKTSKEELEEKIKLEIEKELKTFFTLQAITEKEEIEVKEEEVEKRIKTLMKGEKTEEKVKKIKENLAKQGDLELLKSQIRQEKTIDFLYNEANIKGE
ncbi:MAG: trigger factor [Candidatus Aerophobetes bacterium]|nr:trigger factor [Candidatus Aerophobetes bacterium]